MKRRIATVFLVLIYTICSVQLYSSWKQGISFPIDTRRLLYLTPVDDESQLYSSVETGSNVILVPDNGPDPRIRVKILSAATSNDSKNMMERQIKLHDGVTSAVRLYMPSDGQSQWTLQALNEHGQDKHVGGDEFYVTFTPSYHHPDEYSKLWSDEPDHPTAVALTADMGNGTYTLDFVQSPMSRAAIKQNFGNDNTAHASSNSGTVTIHFVYTAGIGQLAPPTKQDWKHGGAIQASFSVAVPIGPRILAFDPPPQTVDLSTFDHVLLVGDSVMNQFCGHGGKVKFRSNVTHEQRTAPLNTQTVASFVDKAVKAVKSLIARDKSIRRLVVILGSSTWDILADSLGQGVDFANHGRAVRMLLTRVRRRLEKLKGLSDAPVVAWKSATAVHAHVVVDKRTTYFGAPAKALQRIKYMSTSRSTAIYQLQKNIMQEMQVPVLDVYEASLLSGDWHFPTDGRHFRPEFNERTFNWFYATREDVEIDYRFSGYGVKFLDRNASETQD